MSDAGSGEIDDARVEELRLNIMKDFHAKEAAKELLSWATFYIQTGQPAPSKLRDIICDGLEHLEWTDALKAFGHLYDHPKKPGRPRGKNESDYEWLHVLRDILRVSDEGFPLTGSREKYPFKILDGTAFMEYFRRTCGGNETAQSKEARRLQAGFWRHIRALPVAQQEALGLKKFLPRTK